MQIATHMGFMADRNQIVKYCDGLGVRQVIADQNQLPVTAGGRLRLPPLRKLKRELETHDIELACVGIGFLPSEALTDESDAVRRRKVLIENVRVLGDVGIGLSYIFTMVSRGEGDPDVRAENWKRLVGFYERLGAACEQADVRLATHGSYTNEHYLDRPASYRKLLDAAPSGYLGVCACIGCFMECGSDPAWGIRSLGEKVWFVHVRDGVRGATGGWDDCIIGDGEIDLKAIRRALRTIDFRGPVMPEHMPKVSGEPGSEISAARALGYLQHWIREE